MSERDAPADLSAFARPTPKIRRPRRIWTRALLAILALGFLGLLAERSIDALRPARSVRIVRPSPASGRGAPVSAVAAQVAGFIEADPFPLAVSSLVGGVLREILVQSGDRVEAGAILARLDDADAKLALDESEAGVRSAIAARDRSSAERTIAREAADAAIELEAAARRAAAELEGAKETESGKQAAVRGAEAAREVATAELEREESLAAKGAAGPKQVEIVRAKLVQADSALAIARAEAAQAVAARAGAEAASAAAEQQLARKLEVRARVAAADGALAEAEAELAAAAVKRDREKLRLARHEIAAGTGGIVQHVALRPGDPVVPDEPLFVLFDPQHLRARADVPLAQIGRVKVGQRADVQPEGGSRAFPGEVTRITAEADVQKVALRVHVRLLEPGAELIPERLCQVRILDAPEATGTGGSAVRIPREALRPDGSVLVLDAAGKRAERRVPVLAGGETGAGFVVVTEGVNLSDKVILDRDVEPGDAVTPREGDTP